MSLAATSPAAAPAVIQPSRGAVEFDDVWFSYRPGDPVLKGVSFRIEPGERVAVIGATGSGKTTTIKLMSRFYDVDSGVVRVGGRDVRDWDLDALRRHMGVVLQDVFLFSGDILSNLKLGNPDVPEERIRAALRSANAEGFIRRMPGGLQAAVRERGNNLSAGQRQLLALVRMFVVDPEILVLDEATSSVDTETEFLVQGAFEKIMANRTCLVIAHRPLHHPQRRPHRGLPPGGDPRDGLPHRVDGEGRCLLPASPVTVPGGGRRRGRAGISGPGPGRLAERRKACRGLDPETLAVGLSAAGPVRLLRRVLPPGRLGGGPDSLAAHAHRDHAGR